MLIKVNVSNLTST